jgi:hypothetical protein
VQSAAGCSDGAAEGRGTSSDAAAAGSQTWLVQEYCDKGCLQVRSAVYFSQLFVRRGILLG